MSMTDPIADMLTRIRNSNRIVSEKVEIPASRIKESICKILEAEGYIKSYRRIDTRRQKMLRVFLKYGPNNTPAITRIERVSRPSVRRYVTKDNIPRVLGGLGTAILSTSRGLMTGEQARSAGIGGEFLCQIW